MQFFHEHKEMHIRKIGSVIQFYWCSFPSSLNKIILWIIMRSPMYLQSQANSYTTVIWDFTQTAHLLY